VHSRLGGSTAGRWAECKESNNMPYKTEHILIDDVTINSKEVGTIMNPVWFNVSIYDGEKKYVDDLAAFSKGQKLMLAILWYLAEVNNGGHEQFYSNSAGIVYKDAKDAFQELGIDEVVDIITESAKRLGGEPSMDRETRQKDLARIKPNFDDLDDQFYELEKKIDINEKIMEYIENHRTYFYFEGKVKSLQPK
jgi:hypothetical protein